MNASTNGISPRKFLFLSLCLLAGVTSAYADTATPSPIDAFARLPAIRNVAVSPDGKQLLLIAGVDDQEAVATVSVDFSGAPKFIFASKPGDYDLSWCGWANNKRILCGVTATVREGTVLYSISRMVGVDADGANQKVLLQESEAGRTQFQDDILDWTPNEPDTVLMALDMERTGYPAIYEVNVNSGRRLIRNRDYYPIRGYATDGAGNVRFGYGYRRDSPVLEYFARMDNEKKWLPLAKVKAFGGSDELVPIAILPGTNRAFAQGTYEGRDALWEMDLTDQVEPKLVFSHPHVDASDPILTPDRKLIGIYYETDRPFVHYTDDATRAQVDVINRVLPDTFNVLSDYSDDRKVYVVRSYSDVKGPTYYLLRAGDKKIYKIDTAYPELDPKTIGRMQSISYKASDGVEIPGYLTVPPGVRAEKLPLIVMPHGGPIARDSWDFDFLRAFLVSRGYAVLQMNFRGSSGYGGDWFHAAHQDWGGLTYTDITDGTKWAIEKGIADPKRVCVVGWSFGGYAALLSAVRNSDLYRCSASIAGVSDLKDLLAEARAFSNRAIVREQLGTNKDKLKEDSPLRHVANISIPVFLIHGDRDVQVDVDHSRQMASALKSAGKPHQAIFLKNAGHQLNRKSDRVTLLTELEKFLAQNLGTGS
ncbi:alpha/beta hydrolase family protein [Steroidobacter flavus]|uniref:Alpha/beta hydrolase family protein n=1 Tax=Steroidobacter flavus TaxID=1842136 RepID=A0ABV8SMH1_9GAMM